VVENIQSRVQSVVGTNQKWGLGQWCKRLSQRCNWAQSVVGSGVGSQLKLGLINHQGTRFSIFVVSVYERLSTVLFRPSIQG
jgi:hypothetical protein